MRTVKTTLAILWMAALASADSLLLLPISGSMENSGDLVTVNQLYRDAVESQFKGIMLPRPASSDACGDRDCAVSAGRNAGADVVVYSTLNRLGSKWVFSSTILKRNGEAFNQRLTALSVEDFENVTKRMADAILNGRTTESAASVDNITEKEETREPERRRSLSSSGFSAGYLYPVQPSNFNNNSAVIRLAFENNWELRSDMFLNGEIVWGATDVSIGADLNLAYLFTRSDFSPFLGGGVGLHFVNSADLAGNERHSGPALNLQGGMLLFRTYDVHVVARAQYQVIFNDDAAQSIGFNVGVTSRKFSLD